MILRVDQIQKNPQQLGPSNWTFVAMDINEYALIPGIQKTVIFRGPNASSNFIEALLKEEKEIKDIFKQVEPLIMTKDDEINFCNATHCTICDRKFDEHEENKMIDHDHIT